MVRCAIRIGDQRVVQDNLCNIMNLSLLVAFFAHLVALLAKVGWQRLERVCHLDNKLDPTFETDAIEEGALHSRLLLIE
jgi:hypothetical protein